MEADIGGLSQPLHRDLIQVLERSEGPTVKQVLGNIRKRPFNFALGKSRALQIVVMMAQKFSLSRTLSIRCGARPSKSLLCGTTGAETVYRIWTQEVGCAPCRSNGPISTRPIL